MTIATSSIRVVWDASIDATEPAPRDEALERRVIAHFERVGILGCDEEEAPFEIADDEAEETAITETIDRLVTSGVLEREGCYGARLSLTEFAKRCAKAAGDESAWPSVLEILKDSDDPVDDAPHAPEAP